MKIIYGVYDSRDGRLYYVGQTANLARRKAQHIASGHHWFAANAAHAEFRALIHVENKSAQLQEMLLIKKARPVLNKKHNSPDIPHLRPATRQRSPLCVRLHPVLERRLERVAKANATTKSALINRAIAEYLGKLPR